ncbi:MAG: YbjQ family protein [Actinobacteria bacterium]|nr:YbjQ family protein [Actinomycetota bacterium]
MLITTMNDVPGYRIDEVLGECFGLTVRSRGMKGQLGASFKSVVGGELGALTEMLHEGREEGIARLKEEAEKMGANAIIAMRFDTGEMMQMGTEICAYGTACKITKL